MKTVEIKACFKVENEKYVAKCAVLETLIDYCARVQFGAEDIEFSKQVVIEQARILLKQRCSKFIMRFPGRETPDFSESVSDSLLISAQDWTI